MRCKAYANPFFTFYDEGRKATCNLCGFNETEVPAHYYASLDSYGNRMDRGEREELSLGAYEIKAPTAFGNEEPMKPAFVFAFDTSLFSI
jgi:protein transport protein SEC24